jgi:hypothetical protein
VRHRVPNAGEADAPSADTVCSVGRRWDRQTEVAAASFMIVGRPGLTEGLSVGVVHTSDPGSSGAGGASGRG